MIITRFLLRLYRLTRWQGRWFQWSGFRQKKKLYLTTTQPRNDWLVESITLFNKPMFIAILKLLYDLWKQSQVYCKYRNTVNFFSESDIKKPNFVFKKPRVALCPACHQVRLRETDSLVRNAASVGRYNWMWLLYCRCNLDCTVCRSLSMFVKENMAVWTRVH